MNVSQHSLFRNIPLKSSVEFILYCTHLMGVDVPFGLGAIMFCGGILVVFLDKRFCALTEQSTSSLNPGQSILVNAWLCSSRELGFPG